MFAFLAFCASQIGDFFAQSVKTMLTFYANMISIGNNCHVLCYFFEPESKLIQVGNNVIVFLYVHKEEMLELIERSNYSS